jgi:hypothetical protein
MLYSLYAESLHCLFFCRVLQEFSVFAPSFHLFLTNIHDVRKTMPVVSCVLLYLISKVFFFFNFSCLGDKLINELDYIIYLLYKIISFFGDKGVWTALCLLASHCSHFFYYCAGRGDIVTFAEVLTIYQIYHGIVLIDIIFSHLHTCTHYLYYIHPPTPFSHLLPLPISTNLSRQYLFCPPVVCFKKKKKRHFCLFKVATNGVSLWHFHVYMYYNPNWFFSIFFFLPDFPSYGSLTDLKIIYSFFYRVDQPYSHS